MSYNTQQDILDFVEDNNVKFVRFAFCDIFGTQKNIAKTVYILHMPVSMFHHRSDIPSQIP